MRALLFAAFLVSVALAQPATEVPVAFTVNADEHPYGSTICALGSQWNSVDRSSYYSSAFPNTKKTCVKNYLNVCPTPAGTKSCNQQNAVCKDVAYDYNDAVQHPDTAASFVNRPQLCVEEGGIMHPDAATIIIAQIIFSGVVMILGYILFVFFTFQATAGAVYAIVAVFLIDCLLLTFSYYYLNAIIIFSAVTAAGVCFIAKNDYATASGFAILLAALYWVTFQSGLGNIQHQSRFAAGDALTDFYEKQCNAYYRGYFAWPLDQHKENDNIATAFRGLCDRNWLAAELFFMILAEQLLVVYIALGAYLQFGKADEIPISAEAPKPQQ